MTAIYQTIGFIAFWAAIPGFVITCIFVAVRLWQQRQHIDWRILK